MGSEPAAHAAAEHERAPLGAAGPTPYTVRKRRSPVPLVVLALVLVVVGAIVAAVVLSGGADPVPYEKVQAVLERERVTCGDPTEIARADLSRFAEAGGLSRGTTDALVDAVDDVDGSGPAGFRVCGPEASAGLAARGAVVFTDRVEGAADVVTVVLHPDSELRSVLEATGVQILADAKPFGGPATGDTGTVPDTPASQARISACRITRRTIQTALEAFEAQNGRQAATLAEAAAAFMEPGSLVTEDWSYDPTTGTVSPVAGTSYTPAIVAACT